MKNNILEEIDSKSFSDKYTLLNGPHPRSPRQPFIFYIKNHKNKDLYLTYNIEVSLDGIILQKKHDRISLLPDDGWVEVYRDDIFDILRVNLTDKNLTDPKDRGNSPLTFDIKYECRFKKFKYILIKESARSKWKSVPDKWLFERYGDI